MATYPKLTRPQIARIVNNDEQAIRFFEALINRVLTETPDDVGQIRLELEAVTLESAQAFISAVSANAELSRLADALETIVLRPNQQEHTQDREEPSARVSAIEAEIHRLSVEIESLKQGPQP